MNIKRNKKPIPPPAIRTAIKQGVYREIPRHELHPGSWQQEVYDRQGRRFYEPAGTSSEPAKRSETVHEVGAYAAQRGRTLMVFLQAENRSVPYDEYKAHLDAGGLPIGEPMPVPIKPTSSEGRIATKTEVDLVEMSGIHGEELDEHLEIMRELTGGQPKSYPQITAHSPAAIGQPDIPQPGAEAA